MSGSEAMVQGRRAVGLFGFGGLWVWGVGVGFKGLGFRVRGVQDVGLRTMFRGLRACGGWIK